MKFLKHTQLLLAVLLLGLILQNCTNNHTEAKSIEQIYAEEGLPVKVETLQREPLITSYASFAVLTGIRESTANASVADQVEQILHHVGDRVNKDEVIITFPTDNPAAQYMQAKVNVEHMRTTLARMKSLFESGGISQQELDNVAAQCKVAEANWDAVQQAVQVRAPISGILTRIDVQTSDNVNPGDALFTVAETRQLKAQLWVTESQINDIRKGDKAVAYWQGNKISGRVSQVDLSLNNDMQAFGVQVEFDNAEQIMRAGINADVQIVSTSNHAIIKTARKNLVKSGGTYFAYKLEAGKAVKQPVSVGRNIDLDVEITKGLSDGDTIITEGATLVEDGQPVRIIK